MLPVPTSRWTEDVAQGKTIARQLDGDSFVCVQSFRGALTLCLVEDIFPKCYKPYECTEGRQAWEFTFQHLLALSFPLSKEHVS